MIVGSDISKYQGDIDWDVYKNNSNFVIVKASEGSSYYDPKFVRNQTEARRFGLPLGYYHFARPDLDNAPEIEANWFLSVCGELKEGEFLCLDYEANWNGAVVEWCKKFLDAVKEKTNIKCFVYLNQALLKKYDWKPIADGDYALWVAAYTYDPNKNDFVTGAWKTAALQQWTNKQQVPGISGNVDGDVFFGTVKSLKKYGYVVPVPETPPTGTTTPQNGLSERVTAVEIGLDRVNDELSKNTRRLDEIQRSVDVVSADRAILEDIQGKLTELKETVRINSDTLVSTKKELRDEFRTSVELMDVRIKNLENTPVEGEGKKFDILIKLGKLFLGRKK